MLANVFIILRCGQYQWNMLSIPPHAGQ